MTEHKFTDEEVIKALETAIKTGDAPIGVHWACTVSKQTAKDALGLIKYQKEEIERLQKYNTGVAFRHYEDGAKELAREIIKMIDERSATIGQSLGVGGPRRGKTVAWAKVSALEELKVLLKKRYMEDEK